MTIRADIADKPPPDYAGDIKKILESPDTPAPKSGAVETYMKEQVKECGMSIFNYLLDTDVSQMELLRSKNQFVASFDPSTVKTQIDGGQGSTDDQAAKAAECLTTYCQKGLQEAKDKHPLK